MREKKYMAIADNGHEFINFQFYSEHRANSKPNKQDAIRTYRRRHGYRYIVILDTYRDDSC